MLPFETQVWRFISHPQHTGIMSENEEGLLVIKETVLSKPRTALSSSPHQETDLFMNLKQSPASFLERAACIFRALGAMERQTVDTQIGLWYRMMVTDSAESSEQG